VPVSPRPSPAVHTGRNPALICGSNTSPKQEAGQPRQVKAALKAVAFGSLAETAGQTPHRQRRQVHGFLATPRNGKLVVFHIQEFQQD
jgi:primosomal replication protein N